MSSLIPSGSFPEQDPLKLFSNKLNEIPEDKALSILRSVLSENLPKIPLKSDLAAKVTELKGMLARPAELSKEVNVLALQSLRVEMKKMVETKISSLTAKQICGEILTEIPSHRISSFVDTVERFYGQFLLEGKTHQEAFILALGKGMLRSMVNPPSSEEIETNKELQDKLEGDLELHPYICVITKGLVGVDAVYLREDENGHPRERYHEEALEDWIRGHHTDPIDREPRTLADIKPDLKARAFVEKKLCDLLHPELVPDPLVEPVSLEALHSKSLLLALAASHPLIRKSPEEGSARETIRRFASIVEAINWEEELVVSPCFPVIKELISQAEAKLTSENLKEIQADLIGQLEVFLTFFHEIELAQLLSSFKEKALQIAGEAISKGASFEEVMGLFTEFVNSITEESEIRETFPGCLIGKKEWDTHLGAVEEVPLPAEMFGILNQDCPITPGKKVGETHTLVLIPSAVNGRPLTLNSLGALIKSKGHFQATEMGYKYMDLAVANQNGNIPAGPSHWVLMTKEVLPISRNRGYARQQEQVTELAERSRASYEIPRVLDATVCIFMNYLVSPQDERLFLFNHNPVTYTRCQEEIRGYPVMVGSFVSAGLLVIGEVYFGHPFGVAALRKFFP